jgi:hypothetical protein
MSDVLSILKFSSIAASGIFGLCALLGESRNDRRKLVSRQRINLAGVIVTTVIAVALQAVELERAADESQMRDAETRQMILEVRRAVNPLMPVPGMTASFEISIPLNGPHLLKFRERMCKIIDEIKKRPILDSDLPGTFVELIHEFDVKDKFGGLRFTPDSPAWPNKDDGMDLSQVFKNFGLECQMSKGAYRNKSRGRTGVSFSATLGAGHPTCTVNEQIDTLTFYIDDVDIQKTGSWQTDGSITSLDDLADSVLSINFDGSDFGDDREIKARNDLEKTAALRWFSFTAANRKFFISSFIRREQSPIVAKYSYTFPKDLLQEDINLP